MLANFAAASPCTSRSSGRAELVLATHHATVEPRPRRPARRSPERCSDEPSARSGPGSPFPLGATWDGEGTNFSLFSEHAERVELCLFDDDDDEERIELVERTAHNWHCYLPGVGPGPALRLPRARPLRARAGPPLQPATSCCIDPYAKAIEGPVALGRGQRRCPTSRRARDDADLEPDDEDDADAIPKCVVVDPRLRLGGRPPAGTPWNETVIYETHVKGFTKLHPEVREDLRGTYAGLAVRAGDRVPQGARRHRGRAAAGPPHRRRVLPRSSAGCPTTGATARSATSRRTRGYAATGSARRAGARVQGHGQGAAPRGHRGDPRRRLQPHRRGQPPRPDAVLQGRRQRELLPARARRPAPLHGLHGHGQLAQRRAPERPAADHGLAALLGHRVPRRRLPLRPRQRAGARALRRRPPARVLRHDPPGPGALAGQADRRAVGRRPGRLPGRQLPGAVVASGTASTATRCATSGAARRASPSSPRASPARATSTSHDGRQPFASINFITAHDGFTLPTSSPTTRSTTRPTSRTTATAPTTTAPGTAAPRATTDDPEINALRARQQRNFLATLLLSQGVPMLLGGDEFGAHAGRQQQRLVPGQRDLLVRLGPRRAPARTCWTFTQAADRAAPRRTRSSAAAHFLRGERGARARGCPTSGGSAPTAGA